MCVFDRFHLRFNFKSKVSRHHFKNKNECQLTSTFYSKILPQFWFTHYLRKTNILYDQNTILNCNKQTKTLSIEHKYPTVSHVSPNVEDGSPIHCIRFKPTKRYLHKSIKVSSSSTNCKVASDCILFGKYSLTNSYI